MFRALRIVFRAISSPLGQSLLRGLIAFVVGVWALDRIVFVTTEISWWAELGYSAALFQRWTAQAQVFLLGLVSCGILIAVSLPGAVARLDSEPPLPPALRHFQPLRTAMPRMALGLVCLVGLWDAVAFSKHWIDWLRFGSKSSWDFQVPFYGLPVDWWLCRLPLLSAYIHMLWMFSWLLLLTVLLAGVLHSLPLLAARRPEVPKRFTRTVWLLISWLFLLRAAGYLVQFFFVAPFQFDPAGLFLSRPLFLAGTGLCLFLAARSVVRKTFQLPGKRFVFLVALALIGPALVQFFLSPLFNLLLPQDPIKVAQNTAIRTAWNLEPKASGATVAPIPTQAWTPWDEGSLLKWLNIQPRFQREQGSLAAESRVSDWAAVSMVKEKEGWKALAVGSPPVFSTLNARHEADQDTALEIAELRLDPSDPTGPKKLKMQPEQGAFFGLEGASLVASEDKKAGTPFGSWLRKFAWAWRLRNPFLLLEARYGDRLLVYRGLQERVHRLAPFLSPTSPAKPFWNRNRLYWSQTYAATTALFPGSTGDPRGAFGRANAAQDNVRVVMDGATGHLRFILFQQGPGGGRAWELPLPALLNPGEELPDYEAVPTILFASQSRLLAGSSNAETREPFGWVATPEPRLGAGTANSKAQFDVVSVPASPAAAGLESITLQGDLSGRIAELEKEYGSFVAAQDAAARADYQEEPGRVAVWADKSAPGGWWIARAHFLVPNVPATGTSDKQVLLDAVVLAGATGPVSVRSDLGSAWTALEASSPGLKVAPVAGSPNPLAAKALELHKMALEALRQGKNARFGELMQQERELLERMAR